LIEIVVSEDCSPKKKEIEKVVCRFISESDYHVSFNTNTKNVGYDCNLGKLIELARGTYILFMSDDDAFCARALDKVIGILQEKDCAVAFTPFVANNPGQFNRKFKKTMMIPQGIENVKKKLYCSILFSGLIFNKNRISGYQAGKFKNSNYFQVYLFASVLYRYDGYYIDVPLVHCINDGENGFGLNDSGIKNSLLADRKSIYSDLEFHKGLIGIIKIFDNENETNLIDFFATNYSIRAYGGMSRAREAGKNNFDIYYNKMNSLDINLLVIVKIYYWLLRLLGYKICNLLFSVPRKILLWYGNNYVV